jgi:sugar/nucleoside kinase (ribokinase family)
VLPELPTATAVVDYGADGNRTFSFSVAGTAAPAVEERHLGDLPERASWMHVSGSALLFGNPLASTVVAAAHRARAAGATISLDPNVRSEVMTERAAAATRELVSIASYVLPSEGELAVLGVSEDDLISRGAVVCTTLGPGGCMVRTPTQSTSLPAVAPPAEVVDTDGAGDTFAAAFVAGMLAGSGVLRAAQLASHVVARAISVAGPMTVDLTPADVSQAAPS